MKNLLVLAVLLSGCAHFPVAPPNAVKVEIPVSTSCVFEIPAAPQTHTNAELVMMDYYAFVSAIHADRLSLIAYTAKLEAVLQACK